MRCPDLPPVVALRRQRRLGFSTAFGKLFFLTSPLLADKPLPPLVPLLTGANAGFSTALFKLLFPNATVVSLEPDPGNYEALKRNTKG